MKILTISDVHIHNYRFHKEYEQVFEELYKQIEQIKPDYIINCGDTAHTKLNISPAWVDITTRFFKRLAEFCPNILILGNHDLNVKNPDKMDAISPIVSAINNDNICFVPKAEVLYFSEHNVKFHVLSLIDKDNWNFAVDPNTINIGLFHGSIVGAETDIGWVIQHGEIELEQLKVFDYAICGDIHHSQALDKEGRIRYVGNLVQFNFGETDDKGFLVWDIKDKNTFSVEKHVIKNPKPFITINLNDNGELPNNLVVPLNSRLKLVSHKQISKDTLQKALDIAQHRYNPESLVSVTNFSSNSSSTEEDNGLDKLDLQNISVQDDLIREYLKDYSLDEDTLSKIFDVNRELNCQSDEEVVRNSTWKVKYLEWDNFFKYGENNYLNFDNMSGILGLFGNNSSGKTSAVDILLLTMFNTTSKNEKKNINCINYNKTNARSKVVLEIDNCEYTIERKFERVYKSKDKDDADAKVDVTFIRKDLLTGNVEKLNGDTRNETDKNIRKIFGTADDFLLTCVSSQLESLKFINEGWTKRKEILSRFLDLEQFDSKFKKGKELIQEYKVQTKKMADRNFNKEIEELKAAIKQIGDKNSITLKECEEKKKKLEQLVFENTTLQATIQSNSKQSIDIDSVNKTIEKCTIQIDKYKKQLEHLQTEKNNLDQELSKIDNRSNVERLSKLRTDEKLAREKLTSLTKQSSERDILKHKVEQAEKKTDLLKEVPCGEQYPDCKFIKDAISSKKKVVELQRELEKKNNELISLQEKADRYDLGKITKEIDFLEAQNKTFFQKSEQKIELNKSISFIEKNLSDEDEILRSANKKKKEFEEDKAQFQEIWEKQEKIDDNNSEIHSIKIELEKCDKAVKEYYKAIGHAEQKLELIYDQKNEYETSLSKYSILDLFLRCMHPNGIPFMIIKKNLPKINQEIASMLSNIADFQIFLRADERQLNILIQEENEAIPIEVAGGAEKTLATIAIRLALLSITTLPKADLMILDEPGTALDSDNLSSFMGILELLKTRFKSVVLISHLDSLKDCADRPLSLGKSGKFALLQEN